MLQRTTTAHLIAHSALHRAALTRANAIRLTWPRRHAVYGMQGIRVQPISSTKDLVESALLEGRCSWTTIQAVLLKTSRQSKAGPGTSRIYEEFDRTVSLPPGNVAVNATVWAPTLRSVGAMIRVFREGIRHHRRRRRLPDRTTLVRVVASREPSSTKLNVTEFSLDSASCRRRRPCLSPR